MASMVSVVGAGFSCGGLGLKPSRAGGAGPTQWRQTSAVVVVRAEAINPEIRKTEEKVVDSVVVSELSKPLTAYCRCWRSGTFPLCDGSHVKHNKATGDNVGPLLLKKPKE
ncbi:CDGSH iron-sulfur domain-containing protein [Actinidia chinensis var. chinensis]|uniref:CDGSH iron-sulfur domain-containing protein n=1 Tax=Actinidia chinensis var. chinensis TaxID=1590841 RepID=A0A2R6RSY6_ACTCC|nr:CDGSH iron-sulfur domain-containing protein [Actinidia chinensis var. chinensis]